jgi:hypothetical protein
LPSIDEIMAKRQEKMAERPQFDGIELQLRDDKTSTSTAIAVAYSLYSGQEGDPYLEYYLGHAQPAVGKNGGQYTKITYCPVESGHDGNYDCLLCKEGVKLKDRFAMWLWVDKILYNTLLKDEKYPPLQWVDGNSYFTQEVGEVKYWDTSAWRESCLEDISMLARQLKDLRQTRVSVKASNTGMDKRYKFYPEMGSPPIPPELYEECKAKIRPVRDVLMESIAKVPTVQAPVQVDFGVGSPTTEPPANVTQLPAFSAPSVTTTTPPQLPPFKVPTKPEALF